MALGLYPAAELHPGTELWAQPFAGSALLKIRVSNEMARGGSAVVLKGEMLPPGKIGPPLAVALKVILDIPKDECNDYQERIRRELAAVQQIQHRFILPFLGVVLGDSYTVLVSQFMENGHLLEYFKNTPGANRRQLILQVASAVDYLHTRAGLVHGDLKCQNVLVSGHGHAQLADFGLSTTAHKSSSTETTSLGIRQSYTLQFAAPELLSDEAKSPKGKTRSKTPQTDVFAFGRLMLQAFTGSVPWPDVPLHVVFHKILKNVTPERPESATQLGLTDAWWSVCIACWRFDPNKRPPMRDIMLDLTVAERNDHPGIRSSFSSGKPLKPSSLPSIITKLKLLKPPSRSVRAAARLLGETDPLNPGLYSGVQWLSTSTPLDSSDDSAHATRASSPEDVGPLNHHYRCAHCRQPIFGVRYQCASCPSSPSSYNLCAACEPKSYIIHDAMHIFFKLHRPLKLPIVSPFSFVPTDLYRRPAGEFSDGTRDEANPEAYLQHLSHPATLCDWCMDRMKGKWYRCAYCHKDLCDDCEAMDSHNDSHIFVVFKSTVDVPELRYYGDFVDPVPIIPYPVF